jgi:Ice-binding-like
MMPKYLALLILVIIPLICVPSAATAQLSSFAVLAGSTVTNTATPTVVNGNLGVSPGSAVTGFPPGTVVGGSIHAADAVAAAAQAQLTTLYNNLATAACNTNLTGQDLGGKTLTPGVYCFASSAQLTGTLTLDAQGDPNAVFIFQIGSTLTTASAASVLLINGASSCGVFWQIGSSATLGTGTALAGSVVALTSITLNTGASVSGRTLARNGAVTLDDSTVSLCSGGPGLPISIVAVPTLSRWAMVLLIGLVLAFGLPALRRHGATSGGRSPVARSR